MARQQLKEIKYLDQGKVTRYAKLKGLLSKWKKEADALNKTLKVQLEAGYRCPKAGPYVVLLTPVDRSTLSWKDEWETLAKIHHKAQWAAVQAEITKAAHEDDFNLDWDVNPDYRVESVATRGMEIENRPRVRRTV